jgi:aminoglycoside phosphotransferase (APT) family kinase protein
MHDDEIDVPIELVARLVAEQFPEWADLELELLLPWGTDNALYRLGGDKLVRLPRTEGVVGQVERDVRLLPPLVRQLPVGIPEVLAIGAPSDAYPWTWGVYRWLEGESLPADRLDEAAATAPDVARFLIALRGIDPAGAPPARSRGLPLATRDEFVRDAMAELDGRVETEDAAVIWEVALRAPDWDGPPTWIHGDLMPGNLLVRDGRLHAVIDWSAACAGDPACDLMAAWMFLGADSRLQLRAALEVDDATWMRGRGWALSCALGALPYYWDTNPPFIAYARRALAEVLADPG